MRNLKLIILFVLLAAVPGCVPYRCAAIRPDPKHADTSLVTWQPLWKYNSQAIIFKDVPFPNDQVKDKFLFVGRVEPMWWKDVDYYYKVPITLQEPPDGSNVWYGKQ